MDALTTCRRLAWAGLMLTCSFARAADPPASLDGFEVPAGLAVSLAAESPLLHNPTAMDVDAAGRLWVTEAVNYRQWDGRNPGRHHEGGDRVVVLSDTDDDGAFDASHVFVQDPELTAPLGIAVLGSRVFVSCSPHLFVYHDDDGDLSADRRETLFTGFGGHDHDHGLHSVSFGPDGRLVFNAGNAGPHLVTDTDGWRLRSGSIYRGGGATWADNQPGLVSDDGRIWTGGLVLRADLDGGGLEVLAHNFRNPYEVASDSFGDLFQTDNDDDGNQGCRANWILEGGNYGYFSPDGARSWQTDRRLEQSTWRAHWHADDPGVCPPGTQTGSGGPTGVCTYEGTLMPELRAQVFGADAGRSQVFRFTPLKQGSGFGLELDTPLIRSVPGGHHGDRPQLFRPSDVCVDVDGSLLVADWFDPGVGGHGAGDGAAYGRILRIAPEGHVRRVPPIDASGPGGAVFALASPAPSVRALGWMALREAGEAARDTLAMLLQQRDAVLRARGAWLAARLEDGFALLEPLRTTANPRLRVTRARALASRWDPARPAPADEVARLLESLLADGHDHVRRVAAELLQRRHVTADSAEVLPALAARLRADDRWLLEALGTAIERTGVDTDRVLAATADPAARETLRWRLHREADVPHWRALALGESADGASAASAAERVRAVSALAFTDGRAAADAMLELALAGDPVVAAEAAHWIRHHDADVWRAYDLARHLDSEWRDDMRAWSSGVLRAGTAAFDVDVRDATRIALVATDAGDGNSCDWVDWLAPRFVGPGVDVPLAESAWLSAEAGWGSVNRGADCVGGALDVDGTTYTDGLGAHAPARLVFAVPDGAERLRGTAALDDGGTSQGDATSVVFEVFVERPESHAELLAWQALVADAAADPDAREEAAEALAVDPSGGAWLIDRAARGELDAELRALVAESIWDNPDMGLRALASDPARARTCRPCRCCWPWTATRPAAARCSPRPRPAVRCATPSTVWAATWAPS